MADNIVEIGTTNIFPIEVNWVKDISLDVMPEKEIISFSGTSDVIEDYITFSPTILGFQFDLQTPDKIFTFLDFFDSVKGRAYKFWFKIPSVEFTLKENIDSGSTSIPIYRNELDKVTWNNERIWIGMNNGDVITRHVTSVSDSIVLNKHTLNFATPLDRDLTTTNHYIISRLLLCRFVSDEISLNLETDSFLTINCEVIETVKEYLSA